MMRKLIIFFVAFNLMSTEKNIRTISHYSKFLNKEQKINIYIPNDLKLKSVLYLLHGAWGKYSDWVNNTDIENYADKFNILIVMPDGGEFSWYIDSPIQKNWNYESYFIYELMPLIDSLFGVNKNAICGLSMGGYGAIHFGLKYPEKFMSASSLSGVLNISKYNGNKPILDTAFGKFQNNKILIENDLFNLIEKKNINVKLKFDVGILDVYLSDNREFVQKLQLLKYPFEYSEKNGKHDWNYWNLNITDHLFFHQSVFEKSE